MSPTKFRPQTPSEFIGSAAITAAELFLKAERLKQDEQGFFRACFYGPPGIGKSELALVIGNKLAGHTLAVEQINGQSLTVDKVREWNRSLCYRPLYGDWNVKVIDEIDKGSDAAQCELLTLLDKRLPRTAFIATTNLSLEQIPKRNISRMQLYKFKAVDTKELAQWLVMKWQVPPTDAQKIAEANAGDVRGACNDTESFFDRLAVAA